MRLLGVEKSVVETVESSHYKLSCPVCGMQLEDDGYQLVCFAQHRSSLLIAEYATRQFQPFDNASGIFRYRQWLPINRNLMHVGKPIIYQSEQLNHLTGLSDLWIAFNGYWPEKEAFLETCSFKELEAYAVLARLPRPREGEKNVFVVASAGNTAAAFATVCSQMRIPCLIIIPEEGLSQLQFAVSLDPCVKVLSLVDATYAEAIACANSITQQPGFIAEGGVKNVARRDGLGTVLLSAVEAMNKLPDYYFQAIGSGAGAIGVHDMARRFISDGRFGTTFPRLMLSQNAPFAPIYRSWQTKRRTLLASDENEEKQQIRRISARVLSNQHPPYEVVGGVFDALVESQGDMFVANNQEIAEALDLFQRTEGIDINPASGVALATLLQSIHSGRIEKTASVLLNITGGGWSRRSHEQQLIGKKPTLRVQAADMSMQKVLEQVSALFR